MRYFKSFLLVQTVFLNFILENGFKLKLLTVKLFNY